MLSASARRVKDSRRPGGDLAAIAHRRFGKRALEVDSRQAARRSGRDRIADWTRKPMTQTRGSMFVLPDGRNVTVTFILVSSLFLLWGFCNGMIDVMDKHFQEELHLTLAQSAWVQFAHYLGYFLMALPAGWLATKLGYKGGIIAGLLMVAVGGFWFIPATQHRAVLGVPARRVRHRRRPDVPGNDRQSLHHRAGPAAATPPPASTWRSRATASAGSSARSPARAFFYGKDAAGKSTGAETLWIPYAAVGGGRPRAGRGLLLRAGARHQDGGRLPPR